MSTLETASRLVELCRAGKIHDAVTELFADSAVSIEANDSMGPKMVTGLPAIIEKGKMFDSMVETFHGAKISDPVVAGNYFSISWWIDTTMKGRGRSQMQEICVYKVENDKIVSEQFFY